MSEAKVSLVRVEVPFAPEGARTDFARVTFRVQESLNLFERSVLVSLHHYDEADVVTIARSMLHTQAKAVVKATEGWALTDEEMMSKRRVVASRRDL